MQTDSEMHEQTERYRMSEQDRTSGNESSCNPADRVKISPELRERVGIAVDMIQGTLDNLEAVKAEARTRVSSAFAARDDGIPEVRYAIENMQSLLDRWTSLSSEEKNSIPGLVKKLVASLIESKQTWAITKKNEHQIQEVKRRWHDFKRTDAVNMVEGMRTRIQDIDRMSTVELRTLLSTAKSLRKENQRFFKKQELRDFSQLIATIRQNCGFHWWELWS